MINLQLIRLNVYEGKDYTKGVLILKDTNENFAYTLEDKVRDVNASGEFEGEEQKIFGHTAIPYGEYEGFLRYSPSLDRVVPELKDVPHFEHIQIHAGNSIDDIEGCILVGYEVWQDKIWQSYEAERDLVDYIRENGGTFKLKIS